MFASILTAADWKERERHLSVAYGKAGDNHNALRLTGWIDTTARNFHDREYLVISAGNFADLLHAIIRTPDIASLKRLGNIEVARRASHLYDSGP